MLKFHFLNVQSTGSFAIDFFFFIVQLYYLSSLVETISFTYCLDLG